VKTDQPYSGQAFHKGRKNYIIEIYDDTLTGIEKGNDAKFYSILYHEFTHIYNLANTLNNKYMKYKVDSGYKNEIEYYIQKGFNFWTEFYAYGMQQEEKLLNADGSLLDLSKKYKDLLKYNQKIIKEEDTKKVCEMLDVLDYNSQGFYHLFIKFLGGVLLANKKIPEYSQKTFNKEEVRSMYSYTCDLYHLLAKTLHGTYGKYQEKRLFMIGYYYTKNVYEKFGYRVSFKNNRVFEYWTKQQNKN
jgi:hypothetical protein